MHCPPGKGNNLTSIEYCDMNNNRCLGVPILYVSLCSIHSPPESKQFNERRRVENAESMCLSPDRSNDRCDKCCDTRHVLPEGRWKKIKYFIRVWIFSCLSATFVFINPVLDVCVVQVRERNDEPRSPPRFDRSIDTPPTGPRATDWLVCVIGLVSLLCSPPIPVRCHWQQQTTQRQEQQTARRRTVASTFQRPPAFGQGMTAFYPCTILTGRA